MKKLFSIFLFTLLLSSCYTQPDAARGEFAIHSNGLMYGDGDMKTLRFIVDSLNLRFKTCDLSKKFYSKPQAKTLAVTFESKTNDLKSIIEDMKAGMAPDDLLRKYSAFVKSSDKFRTIIRSDKDIYLSGTPGTGYDQETITDEKKFNYKNINKRWSYTYEPRDKYSEYYSLNGFFFTGEFVSTPIPDEYGKLIQYVDCMIDTASVIYLTDKYERSYMYRKLPVYTEINSYINSAMKRKKNGKDDPEYDYISADKIKYATENLKNDYSFIRLVESAAEQCMEEKQSDDVLETLIGEFVSKESALYLKRCRRVVGQCSMDNSPRVHARSIALLAAEAHNWDIFLRAHLDIMNDRFERMSDGSYAWGQRQTYLKELEELNLNIVDLMLGLTLRAENVANNHYHGTIWRMGRALAESRDKDLFEKKAMGMLRNESLDEFNRGLVLLLYYTYTSYLPKNEGAQKREFLRKNIDSFPASMQASVKTMKEPTASD